MEAPLLLPVSAAACSSTSITVDDDDSHGAAPNVSPSRASPSGRSIAARYLAVALVAAVSLFAQHEASKGFRIDVVPGGGTAGAAGKRFDLLFVANGRAERVLHRASRRVEEALFPDPSFPRRRVARVTVRLMAGGNLTAADATVDAVTDGGYVISLSPRLLSPSSGGGSAGAADAVATAVRRAVARMWLWDGRGAAPARVTESMVEYLATAVPDEPSSPAEERPSASASNTHCISPRFLKHLERRRAGFVARLNRAMRDRWSDAAVDAALGAPARPVCAAYLAAATETGGQRPSLGGDSKNVNAEGPTVNQPQNTKRQKTGGTEGRRNRASPARLFKLNKDLNFEKKGAIIEKEFGGLLDLAANSMRGDLSQWTMRHYDPKMSQIVIPERGKIPVDVASVRRIWGLPNRGKKVCFDNRPETTKAMYNIYNITSKNSPTLTNWCKMIKEMNGSHDDDFVRAWLALAFSSFLAPSTSLSISPKSFPTVMDVNLITETNICQFVVDQLKLAFTLGRRNKKAVCCCVFHIVLLYLDSLDVDEPIPNLVPRVSVWNSDLISKVIKKDRKAPGEYDNLREASRNLTGTKEDF
ncbi:hypothetical protein ZWY2020_045470 [Hordeum vulgare]|nr:hypothetical protein ZWY2020_045470 [Hordeum vulgare]